MAPEAVPRLLLFALATGLSLRLGTAVWQRNALVEGDAAQYADIAKNVVAGGEFAIQAGLPTASRPPLYPAFLVPFHWLCRGSWACARAAQAVVDAGTIWLVYLFGLYAMRDARQALAGAWLYALHPIYIAYTAHLLTETVFFASWMATLWLLLRAIDTPAAGARWAAAAGLAMGLTILCRPNFILFPPGAAGLLFLFHGRKPERGRKLAIALVCAYLTLIPWSLRNHRVLGAWVPVATGGGPSVWSGAQVPIPVDIPALQMRVGEGRTEAQADAEFYRMAKAEYRRNWKAIAKDMPSRFAHFWLTSHSAMLGSEDPLYEYRARGQWLPVAVRVFGWALQLAVLGLGAWGVWRARSAWTPACTLTVAAFGYYSLHLFTGYWTARYHLPALILLVAFAGGSLIRLRESFRWSAA